ncbi:MULTISPECIES: DNA cytosine methyltransferase [unclassified Mesorhizobium]|nr:MULTISPECIES: DNA cytosine methyltransferase [unclassified Mesorhizobium]ESZ48913.1 DNA-cytosine methyltransferase [Mesorhizobium sp. L2C054A000]
MISRESNPVAVVDLFSGPGGLGEGFSACRTPAGERQYQIDVSIEKEASAHQTLRLRAFLRQFDEFPSEYHAWLNGESEQPDWKSIFPFEWAAAEDEARCLELGLPETSHFLESRIQAVRSRHRGRTILIGGPPCQAYSLVGRARNAGIAHYQPQHDHRNFLYNEYVKVLEALKPAAFVMENVRGMLSAAIEGSGIFLQVMEDLKHAGGTDSYRLLALAPSGQLQFGEEPRPQDFIVRAEEHGVPQARHRVIIIGVRRDVIDGLPEDLLPRLGSRKQPVTLSMVLGAMPRMRSGLSRADDAPAWVEAMAEAIRVVKGELYALPSTSHEAFVLELRRVEDEHQSLVSRGHGVTGGVALPDNCPSDLRAWLSDAQLYRLPQNETRGHMSSDLGRYLFAACYGRVFGVSPKAADFPAALAPNHRNWETGKFNDRFRVQLANRPSSTVTSHISKDGHYFIHPDPAQCRSLTVREAARLQTFPDNYTFLGNRTEQYVQVGNAVPPFLAWQIAEKLFPVLNYQDAGEQLGRQRWREIA